MNDHPQPTPDGHTVTLPFAFAMKVLEHWFRRNDPKPAPDQDAVGEMEAMETLPSGIRGREGREGRPLHDEGSLLPQDVKVAIAGRANWYPQGVAAKYEGRPPNMSTPKSPAE